MLVSNLGTGLHIDELSVSAAHQRQGLGRQLIERVQNVAIARGCASVTLTTFRDVAWNRPYYEHLGFEVCDVSRAPALEAVMLKEAEYGLQFCDRCSMIYRIF
ncbi:GNAT family N-acetyltransferase [Morganella morganii]